MENDPDKVPKSNDADADATADLPLQADDPFELHPLETTTTADAILKLLREHLKMSF